MFNKYLILISTILCVHVRLAVPYAENVDAKELSAQDLRRSAFDFLTIETETLRRDILQIVMKRFTDFLYHAQYLTTSTSSPEIEQIRTDLTQFLSDVAYSRSVNQALDLRSTLKTASNLLFRLESILLDGHRLYNNDGDEYFGLFRIHLKRSYRQLVYKLDLFLKQLLESQYDQSHQEYKKFVEWYANYKNERNIFGKFKLIEEFFDIDVCLSRPFKENFRLPRNLQRFTYSLDNTTNGEKQSTIINFLENQKYSIKIDYIFYSITRFKEFLLTTWKVGLLHNLQRETPELHKLCLDLSIIVAKLEKIETYSLDKTNTAKIITEVEEFHGKLFNVVIDEYKFDDYDAEEFDSAMTRKEREINSNIREFFEKMVSEMSPELKEQNKGLLEWLEKFKKEANIYQKFEMVNEYFGIPLIL